MSNKSVSFISFSLLLLFLLGFGLARIFASQTAAAPTASPIPSHLVVVGHSIQVGRLTFREVYDEQNHVRCYTVENYYNSGSGGISCVKETVK